ncbi:MAG: hypothetical protein AB7I42_25740 [Bradyrhizobium sp.]|uniref:hypothetical protein n=1 Tax=Bradyrhizobium sp. TaxID=376 RepID=UPI003D0D5E81
MTTIEINKRDLMLLHAMVSARAAELRKHIENTPSAPSLATAQEIEELETLARKLRAER